MKITDTRLAMAASGRSTERMEEQESLEIRFQVPARDQDRVSVSAQARQCKAKSLEEAVGDAEKTFHHSLKALLVEVLLGCKVPEVDPDALSGEGEGAAVEVVDEAASADAQPPETQEGSGWGMIYEHSKTYTESQEVSVAGAGVVRTADGREIGFQVELSMSREFVEHHKLNIRAGDAALVDPLVLNFGGRAAELSDVRFGFDLDGDGKDDAMPGLAPGSGYLALDRNENGEIDDGGELFGPKTGRGFQELAAYDEDQNGWIDEGDALFDRLSLWEVDSQGERLSSLEERGVGAIFLGSLEAPFDLKDEANALQGRIARPGLFLEEDGTAGTVQELDLKV